MRASEIDEYLKALGKELVGLGCAIPIRLMLFGGAFMVIKLKARRSTYDIDVYALHLGNEDTGPGLPVAGAIYEAAGAVARSYSLPRDWFNTIRRDHLRVLGPIVPSGQPWRIFNDILEIYLPSSEWMFVLKAITHRSKDIRDIRALARHLDLRGRQDAHDLLGRYLSLAEQDYYDILYVLDTVFPV